MIFNLHINKLQENQVLYASHIEAGLNALGMRWRHADFPGQHFYMAGVDVIDVCIGPNYAYNALLDRDTIYIDRCLWGDDLEFVTIGWLNQIGGMVYPVNAPDDRPKPALKEWNRGGIIKPAFLMDYGPYSEKLAECLQKWPGLGMRPHPATHKNRRSPAELVSLQDYLKPFNLAIGHRTSALFTAVTEGVPVICFDERNSVYPIAGTCLDDIQYPDRAQWLRNMSYAQWSGEEIRSGEALNYVLNNHPTVKFTPYAGERERRS